ncbi:MAG: GerMN domain-containing protein [Treponema sp.]|jgi:hypothetical protein|nr:GerMN domain-containing protein [Treponema sp.]
MRGLVQEIPARRRFRWGIVRRFLYLLVLGALALIDFRHSELVRRTFVFYARADGATVVEERMLKRAQPPSLESEIRRYVEEVLLGPISPDSAPLFPGETRLRSLLFRDGVLYVDLSEAAALPLLDGSPRGTGVFSNIYTLNEGIRRNFAVVKEVRFFIIGRQIFRENFSEIFVSKV